jgi:hypothetical protein
MAWRIKIHPEEAERLTVTLEGQVAFEWNAGQGHVEWPFPDRCRETNDVRMVCIPYPNGRNANIAVWWDNRLVYERIFDAVDERTLNH